jgi:hypothetical protein
MLFQLIMAPLGRSEWPIVFTRKATGRLEGSKPCHNPVTPAPTLGFQAEFLKQAHLDNREASVA